MVRLLDRHCHRHGNDLRADHLAELPAVAVARAVDLHHRRRGRLRGGVAAQAGAVLDGERPRQVEGRPGRRCARAHQLLALGVVAEVVDDVDFPFGGAVARVGRIERRFLVRVVGVRLAQLPHDLGGAERRHALRQELVFGDAQIGPHMADGVGAHRHRRFHHQSGAAQHFVARIALQELVRDIRRDAKAGDEDE